MDKFAFKFLFVFKNPTRLLRETQEEGKEKSEKASIM